MADQHTVRALVPEADVDRLTGELEGLPRAGVVSVRSSEPPAATYRDEQPDRRLHQLWHAGRGYLAVGAVIGALLGAATAFVVPGLRTWWPYTVPLMAFGFAWGGAAFGWGRGAQVAKREDDLGEEEIVLDERRAQHLRLLTVEVQHDRETVADLLAAAGATLLDARHPLVGPPGPLSRPDDAPGTPEGQRTGTPAADDQVDGAPGAGSR